MSKKNRRWRRECDPNFISRAEKKAIKLAQRLGLLLDDDIVLEPHTTGKIARSVHEHLFEKTHENHL